MKYFHKVTKVGFSKLVAEKKTWKDIMENYSQPSWCSYPDALSGAMGCWSLTSLMIKNKRSCSNCDQCK
jgi:hypothetical protein